MKSSIIAFCLSAILSLPCANFSLALCLYQPEAKAIWIYDYPRSVPCTLKQLLAADKMFEWGLVTYDASNDTYTVAANLWIGRNNNTDTYVQIGSREHPGENLVLKGDLVLYPWQVAGENQPAQGGVAPPRVNRFTLGVADDPTICATLRIHNNPGEYHTILSGPYFRGAKTTSAQRIVGGEICVYHSTITAAIQDKLHAIGAAGNQHMYLPGYGGRVVLHKAILSWVAGVIAFGLDAKSSDVQDSVFENSGYALINRDQAATNCVFRNLRTAVLDWGGPLDARLTACTFTNNDANWSLSRGRLVCVDCSFGPPRKGNIYKNRPEQRAGKTPYAMFLSSRHIIVEVKDETGKAIKDAQVICTAAQDAADVLTAVTDAHGKTPGIGSDRALLLKEFRETATDVENQPRRVEYTYALTVKAAGYATITTPAIRASESWQTFPITLNKAAL